MKTIEEKAKAYDELIPKLKEWHDGLQDRSPAKDTLELILPQFRESEDERIRKRAVAILKQQRDFWSYDGPSEKFPPSTPRKDLVEAIDIALSYLEKQKEHVPENEGSGTQEQKPAWSEEDKQFLLVCKNALSKYQQSDKWDADIIYKWLVKRIKSYNAQQKPEWSEEETKLLDSIIDDYEKASKSFCGYDGKIGLLRAIRDGEYNLPKPAWSEEDEKNMATLFEILNCYQRLYDGGVIVSAVNRREFLARMTELSNWLKSLRPSWKPTEEQLHALERICSNLHLRASDDAPKLDEIIEQLKQK